MTENESPNNIKKHGSGTLDPIEVRDLGMVTATTRAIARAELIAKTEGLPLSENEINIALDSNEADKKDNINN